MPRLPTSRRAAAGCLLALTLAVGAGVTRPDDRTAFVQRSLEVRPRPAAVQIPRAQPAPAGLPKISYWAAPAGFPADPDPSSAAAVTEGLRPQRRLPVYDAPGGRARALLPRSISGLPVVLPVVERRPGWVAVLLPTLNRRIGWLPRGGWESRPLRDRLILDRGDHRLTWLRDGVRQGEWRVAVGSRRTPTPLGRTFVMGRTDTRGDVYAGLDAIVLGAVPEDRDALAASLRDGHTAIHAWHSTSVLGRSISNGCVRLAPDAQRHLLRHIGPGTPVHVMA